MKKFTQILSIILSVAVLCLLCFTVYGAEMLPDEDSAFGRKISYYSIFTAERGIKNSFQTKDMTENDNLSTLKLFRTIPVKTINLSKSERRYLEAGGELIGIRLKTNGVFIVGTEEFNSSEGKCCPAEEAGIIVGDSLVSINGKKIKTNQELSDLIEGSMGNSMSVNIIRDGKNMQLSLRPRKAASTGRYKGGLWIRDSTGGIGTLTYRDRETGKIASLGHGIYDIDTGSLIPAESGYFLDAELIGVEKGKAGKAGELKGVIGSENLGLLKKNTDNGIYGDLENCDAQGELYPVADFSEIKTGKANILTTVEGQEKDSYEIEIKDITEGTGNKNMIIQITDRRLLEKTGGIVQGMSGSPIIQNGLIIGAVTHVFLNDPARGYGIFIGNMLDTAA